jgi:hypothetical protein
VFSKEKQNRESSLSFFSRNSHWEINFDETFPFHVVNEIFTQILYFIEIHEKTGLVEHAEVGGL